MNTNLLYSTNCHESNKRIKMLSRYVYEQESPAKPKAHGRQQHSDKDESVKSLRTMTVEDNTIIEKAMMRMIMEDVEVSMAVVSIGVIVSIESTTAVAIGIGRAIIRIEDSVTAHHHFLEVSPYIEPPRATFRYRAREKDSSS
jgi:hypothetical protein